MFCTCFETDVTDAVARVDGGAVGAVARAAVERVLHVQRQVDVHVSEVEKEGLFGFLGRALQPFYSFFRQNQSNVLLSVFGSLAAIEVMTGRIHVSFEVRGAVEPAFVDD